MDAQVMGFMCHEPDASGTHQTGCIRANWFHASSLGLLRFFGLKWMLDTLSDPSCPPWTHLLCRKRGYPREMCSYGRSKHSCSSSVNKLTNRDDCSGPKSDQHFLFDKDHSQTPSPTICWTQQYLMPSPHWRGVWLRMLSQLLGNAGEQDLSKHIRGTQEKYLSGKLWFIITVIYGCRAKCVFC